MDTRINIDNSSLSPVSKCTTCAALKLLGLAGLSKNDPMDVGSVVHDGLEGHFGGGNAFDSFERSWASYFPSERIIDRDNHQYVNVRDIFDAYIMQHPADQQPFEVLETEKMVGMPLDESGDIWFWMKRDLKVVERATGAIVPLDHKTTGFDITGLSWQKKWRLASQLSGYVWATQKETGTVCPFAYVNAIQINKLPHSDRKCYTHKLPYSECRLMHTNFVLLQYTREQTTIEQWWRDCMMLGYKYKGIKDRYPDLETIQYAPAEGTFSDSCGWCEFDRYCRMGKLPRTADALLTYSPWRPWENDDVKIIDWRKGGD